MKPTYQIAPLSVSGNYSPINITAIDSVTPNNIHVASATDFDELWIEAFNYSNNDVVLTLAIGGTAAHQLMSQVIPHGRGLIPVLRGSKMSGSINVDAFATQSNAISILGYVHKIIFI